MGTICTPSHVVLLRTARPRLLVFYVFLFLSLIAFAFILYSSTALSSLLKATKDFKFRVPRANNPGEFPGTYIEHPMFYQFANTDTGLQVSFVLANTIWEGDIDKNQELMKKLIEESRPRRGSALEMTFPRIYEIKVPGLRYIRWAYLANAAFNLLGQRRDVGGKIVPEAYGISLVFNSLTIESENFIERAGM